MNIKMRSCFTSTRFVLGFMMGIIVGYFALDLTDSKWPKPNTARVCRDGSTTTLQDQKKLIFIGMMSTKQQLRNRALASLLTWAKRIKGADIEIFAETEDENDPRRDLFIEKLNKKVKIIQLPGVKDDVYPSQKKSFSMLKYMHDVKLNKFDWFVRLDDDAYIDVHKLVGLLAGVNSSAMWYIGNAGYGKEKQDFILHGENYCMGGSGVVMSRGLLRKIGPNLSKCFGMLYTSHEDVELGRCVARIAGVKCSEAWQSTRIFYQNYQHLTYAQNIHEISSNTIDSGIIFHANKEPKYQIRFHITILKRKISWLIHKIAKLERNSLDEKKFEWTKATEPSEVLSWNSMVDTVIFKSEKRNLVREMHQADKILLTEAKNKGISLFKSEVVKRNLKLVGASLIQAYMTIDPNGSIFYYVHNLLQIKLKTTTKKKVNKKLKQFLVVKQQFTRNCVFMDETSLLSEQNVSSMLRLGGLVLPHKPRVNFVMALSGRPTSLKRFLHNFESVFLSRDENVNLYIAYFPDLATSGSEKLTVNRVTNMLQTLQILYPKSIIKVIRMTQKSFSRGMGLQKSASYVTNMNEILFFCDVDLVFSYEILKRIRENTIQGTQVYYPTFFSQYDPGKVYQNGMKPKSHFSFAERDGFWRHYSYGMLSMFNSDFMKINGFDLSIVGWGLEDLHLADQILHKSNLQIFKSPEPAEVHVYHDKFCSTSLPDQQFKDCRNSRASHFGPNTLLYQVWKNKVLRSN